MFGTGDSIVFSFDEHRRLRLSVPEEFLPLAAWLHTDVQPNLPALDELVRLLQRCRQEERTLLGNGCSVDFVNELVLLESLYETWPRAVVPQSLFWSVLEAFRGFLVNTADEPRLVRPEGYPQVTRKLTEYRAEGRRLPSFVDHTIFPAFWTRQQVAEAGEGAWQSPEFVSDAVTGAWSGMWRGLELAGYYNPATGDALTYFPVISP